MVAPSGSPAKVPLTAEPDRVGCDAARQEKREGNEPAANLPGGGKGARERTRKAETNQDG